MGITKRELHALQYIKICTKALSLARLKQHPRWISGHHRPGTVHQVPGAGCVGASKILLVQLGDC